VNPPVPVVVVPGLAGYALESESPGRVDSPVERLQSLLLSLLERREDRPATYLVALPGEPILSRELLPDASIDGFEKTLRAQADAGRLLGFAYDWRADLTASAARLSAELVEQAAILGVSELDLVGLGPGSLLVRYLVESGALGEGASLVRRIVHIGSPGLGLPALLVVLSRVLSEFEPERTFGEALRAFPSVFQLLPPRGQPYVHLDGSPGVRIEPFAWPEAWLGVGAGAFRDRFPEALLAEAAARNEALHGRLRPGFHPSFRRTLAFASASEPTYLELALRGHEALPSFVGLKRAEAAGDGLAPVVGAWPGPGVRVRMLRGRHAELATRPGVQAEIAAFLAGPLA
jgi:hypothetical protein